MNSSTIYLVLGQGLGHVGRPPGAVFSRVSQRFGGSGGVGAFGAISLFFLRRRGRSCVRLAGTVVYNADEPDSWPDSDYS